MSQTDIMVALYYKFMKFDPKKPLLPTRDRFILSKGHGGVGHAVILGDLGFFDQKELADFNKTGSPFGMHLVWLKVNGVDASTGSLGHGLSIGIGMAIAARLQNKKYHTYVVVGDGELHGGPNWEAIMSAAHFQVTNMTTFVDRNKLCIDGPTEKIMGVDRSRTNSKPSAGKPWSSTVTISSRSPTPSNNRTRNGKAFRHYRRHRQGQGHRFHGGLASGTTPGWIGNEKTGARLAAEDVQKWLKD
jgi:hypothetical protein